MFDFVVFFNSMFFLNLTPNRNTVTVQNKNQLSEKYTSTLWVTGIMLFSERASPDENMFQYLELDSEQYGSSKYS